MNKAYNAINWKNEPSTSTAINETNLNKMDRAIDTIDNRVIDLDNGKVNKEDGKSLVSNTDIPKIGANETAIQTHISNKSNPHLVTKAQVGLGNVDNTSDVNKPISTAQQAEFDAINNNLAQLEQSGISGGKNVINEKDLIWDSLIQYDSETMWRGLKLNLKPNTTYYISGEVSDYKNVYIDVYDITNSINKLRFVQNSNPKNGSFTTEEGHEYVLDFYTKNSVSQLMWVQIEEGATATDYEPYIPSVKMLSADVDGIKSDLSDCLKKSDITTNETLIGTFNGKNYYRKLFTGISGSGGSVTVNVGEKIEIYNYYGRAYVYGQSGASAAKYPIPNKNYYIESQNISETSFQLTIPTSSDTRKVDLVIEYTKVDE